MKMMLSIVVIAVLQISINVLAWDLKCGLNSFQFQSSASEFPGWDAVDIKIGSCSLGDVYALSETYKNCNFDVATIGDELEVTVSLHSIPITTVITRKKPVEFKIGCTFHMKSQVSAQTPVEAIVGSIGGLVTRQGKPMQFTMKYVNIADENAVLSDDSPLKIPVGKDVEVEVSGPYLEEFNVYATISDCFATPSADPNDDISYSLVEKMCIQDQDVSIRRKGRGQIIKFKSFAFTKKALEMVYLHCDVFACTSLKSCSKCVKDWRSISKAWIKQWDTRIRIAMVFAPNTIQTLTRDNIRCERNGIRFKATQKDFPLWKGSDLMIGTCPLNDDFELFVTYAECGLEFKERRHQLLIQTELTGKKPTGTISRKRPIRYIIRCGYDRFDRVKGNSIQPIIQDATSLGSSTNNPDMFLDIYDTTGHLMDRATMPVQLRDTVAAVIGGKDVGSLGMKLYAINCFVTPTNDPKEDVRHNLLKDSCPVDDTFRLERFGVGQKIHFDAFEFTGIKDSQMFLHCDVTACLDNENCGVCNSDQNRRKRATYYDIRKLSRSFTVA